MEEMDGHSANCQLYLYSYSGGFVAEGSDAMAIVGNAASQSTWRSILTSILQQRLKLVETS